MSYTPEELAEYVVFIRDVMGIDDDVLPDESVFIPLSLGVASNTVNMTIRAISPLLYSVALNNLAGDVLMNMARDVEDSTFFADYRKTNGLLTFVGGVIASSGDEGTYESLATPESLKGLTIANLQNLKTPWGRQYLAIAQSYGPAAWVLV